MDKQVQLRTFTVSDLRKWLVHNQVIDGLSESVISRSRAYAIINNPFVDDQMYVVCALFVNDQLAAFTAAFPEVLEKPKDCKAWWFTTLWCHPKYEGRGYGLIVVGTLFERIESGSVFDVYGSNETIEIFKRLGLSTTSFTSMTFFNKHFSNSIRGKVLSLVYDMVHLNRDNLILKAFDKSLKTCKWTTSYSSYVDDEAFSFMSSHIGQNAIFRKQETFNWILKFPFIQSSFFFEGTQNKNHFSSNVGFYQSIFVKIYIDGRLVAVSLLVFSDGLLSFKYLYYEIFYMKEVFTILLRYVIRMKFYRIELVDIKFSEFINSWNYYSNIEKESRSFSYPESFKPDYKLSIQGGEGDLFV